MTAWKTRSTQVRVLAVTVAFLAAAGAASAGGKAPRPEFMIPRLEDAPTVDGVLAEGEWDRAAAVTGFIAATGSLGGRMVPIESRIYLCHDGSRFYVGVYCELPPGVKPSMKYRRRDAPVYMDTYQTEMWLAPPVRGKLKAYQMIGNAYGAIYDVEQIPALGAVTPGWNGNWEFKNSYRRGEYWTAEISIPFADFGIEETRPDEFWGGMVAVAWPQRSWPYTFGWYKNVDTHAKFYMSDTGTCVRVDDLSSLFDNKLAPRFTLVNGERGRASFTLRAAVGDVAHEEEVSVSAGGTRKVAFSKALPAFPAGLTKKSCRVKVTGPGGKTLLSGDWFFKPVARKDRVRKPAEPEPWKMTTRIGFAPLAMGVKAWADVLDYPKRKRLRSARFTVRRAGGGRAVLSEDVTKFAYDAAEKYLWLPKDLPFGKYEVLTQFLDGRGKTLDEKVDSIEHKDLKKEFVWLGTDCGEKITVAPPFEPLKVEAKKARGWLRRRPGGTTFRVWGREITMKGALPEQITSRGEEMLARPISFVAVVDGEAVRAKLTKPITVTESDDVRAAFTGRYRVAGLDLSLSGRLEYDGMIHYTLKAEPLEGIRGRAIERLYVSMPVKAERATYYASTSGGWQPAFGLVSDLPETGVAWSSDKLGDFVPYVSLSDDDRAIHWFADDDHDWVLGEDAPCAQIVRKGDVVEIQVNLVRRKGAAEPFAAEFGFIASPVKPLPSAWRNTSLHFAPVANSEINFFYGPGHGGCPIDPHDTAKLAQALGIDTKGRNPDIVLRDLPAGSGKFDRERLKAVLGEKNGDWAMRHAQKKTTVRDCYFFNAKMYFEGYRSKAFQTFFPGEWTLDPSSGWFHLTPVESYRDFFAFHMDLWVKHWVVAGLYFDEVYLAPDYNVFNGNGKVMPDGSIRPSVPLMHQRRFLNRMRQVFLDHGKKPFVWVHTSNYMAPHAISAADIAMFGEDRAATPQTDIIDTIPPLLFRSIGRSQKFGFIPVWMVMAGRGGPGWSMAGRQTYGWCWMHDTVPEYHTCSRGRPLAVLRQAWGIDEGDVKFVPYWLADGPVTTRDEKFIVSAWTRPGGKVLLQVMNLHYEDDGVTDVRVTLEAAALGLVADREEGGFTVYDVEADPKLVAWEKRMREADGLHAQDPAGNKTRIDELIRGSWEMEKQTRYDKALFSKVGSGRSFRLSVPARDFKTLVVE